MRTVSRKVYEARDGKVFLTQEECHDHEAHLDAERDSVEARYFDSLRMVSRYKAKKLPDVHERYMRAKHEAFASVLECRRKAGKMGYASDKLARAAELLNLMRKVQGEYAYHRGVVNEMTGRKRDARLVLDMGTTDAAKMKRRMWRDWS